SDVSEISRITRARGIPLIVDEPCGAHLGFSDFFSGNAVSAGADVTVQNLYSTLPSLTQTALIHAGGMCNTEKLKYALDLFSPEKPSFPLICAADACVEYVKNSKERSFEKWRKNIELFEKKTKKLTNLKIQFSEDDKDEHKNVFAFDKSKIIVSTQGTDMTGYGLMKALEESKIKIESAGTYFAVISTGMLDGSGEISRLAKALCNIDKKLRGSIPAKYPDMQDIPEIACTSAEAARHNSESVFAGEAEGSVSAEYIWAYPSFVPFIVPGEIFDANVISRIRNASTLGACVICSDKSLKTFKVIKK
ncbi:MAG: hypothetical protein KBS59_02915, partial [Clostridiales bacterium]|nr:hypothetical protein [Clostridiales bacterium]